MKTFPAYHPLKDNPGGPIMNRIRRSLLAGLAAVTLTAPAIAAAETLSFATTLPPNHPIVVGYLQPWADRISADGVVQIDIRHGAAIATAQNVFDRVTDDVVQIGWGLTIFNAGQFRRTLVSTLPFMVDTARQGSTALWNMHAKGAFDKDFTDIVPLLIVEFPQASLNTSDGEISSLDDMLGKRVITSSPAVAPIVATYGGAPLSFDITEQYEALQRGTADGTVLNFTALEAFRLQEVVKNHYVIPMGGAMGLVFASRAAWDGLSEQARASIMQQSGLTGSTAFGQFIDRWEAEAIARAEADPERTVTRAGPAEIDALKADTAPAIRSGFSQNIPDGAKLLDMFKAELDAAK
jgi:TRAP-type C4-dicarboxylate transport system substrate-binding protein